MPLISPLMPVPSLQHCQRNLYLDMPLPVTNTYLLVAVSSYKFIIILKQTSFIVQYF